jgi:hypothetical protein
VGNDPKARRNGYWELGLIHGAFFFFTNSLSNYPTRFPECPKAIVIDGTPVSERSISIHVPC